MCWLWLPNKMWTITQGAELYGSWARFYTPWGGPWSPCVTGVVVTHRGGALSKFVWLWLSVSRHQKFNSSFCSPISSPWEIWRSEYRLNAWFFGARLFRQVQKVIYTIILKKTVNSQNCHSQKSRNTFFRNKKAPAARWLGTPSSKKAFKHIWMHTDECKF